MVGVRPAAGRAGRGCWCCPACRSCCCSRCCVLVGLLAPPFDAAKGALLPEVLEGDRYVVGSAVLGHRQPGGQVAGFLLGGALVAAAGARGALAVDAATFLLSALAARPVVRERPRPRGGDASLAATCARGSRLVAGAPALRRHAGLGLLGAVAMVAPEGLAVPVADQVGGGRARPPGC